ncbi:hypothetical protein [Streptomyces rishiriensis]|uniref:Uncharacterized protein n=1 Tax=Streptomyces rishiriensis TaxID=68264 RepID=A0ABU0NFV6_STRRH|nr:hypothetical protein [Streptomyces rishiriensis]MDQ0577979.1 hypothetical protein [Streptomyces rishiriensis]
MTTNDASPYGRWTDAEGAQGQGQPADDLALALALYGLNERSSGGTVRPTAALITVSRPDGRTLGTFRADTEDAEILAARILQHSDDRYGPLHASALEALL